MNYRAIAVIVPGRPGLPVRLESPVFHDRKITNSDGYVLFQPVPDATWQPAANLFVDDPTSQFYGIVVQTPAGNHQFFVGPPVPPDPPGQPGFNIALPPLVPNAPPRLHVVGLGFYKETGEPWRMKSADSFRAYERFLAGQDLRPVFAELRDLGANCLRVLGMFDFGTPQFQRLYPSEHPDYFPRLPAFFQLAAEYGFYVQWCVFADTQRACPGAGNQTNFWNQTIAVCTGITNVLIQRVNEGNQHENRVDGDTQRPASLCASFGSNGTGDDPPQPFWDYCDLGSERRGDFALSTTTVNFAIKGYPGEGGHPGFGGTQRATVVSEPPGFADVSSGSRTNDPVVAYQLGVGAAVWGAGGTAHSDCGVQSVLLTPIQKECVRQFLRGVSV